MLTEEQFISHIKENKFIENPWELVEHRIPIIQYYVKFYTSTIIPIQYDNQLMGLNSKNIIINKPNPMDHINFTAMNMAYVEIVATMTKLWQTQDQ